MRQTIPSMHETGTGSFALFAPVAREVAASGDSRLSLGVPLIFISYFGDGKTLEAVLSKWQTVCVTCGWPLLSNLETLPLFGTLSTSLRLAIFAPVASTSLYISPTRARILASFAEELGDCYAVTCSHSDRSSLPSYLVSKQGICAEFCGGFVESGRAFLGGPLRLGEGVGHWHALTVASRLFCRSKFPPGLLLTLQQFAMTHPGITGWNLLSDDQ